MQQVPAIAEIVNQLRLRARLLHAKDSIASSHLRRRTHFERKVVYLLLQRRGLQLRSPLTHIVSFSSHPHHNAMPPLIVSSNPPPSWMDEETRQMVLKKTWCHGQLVAPLYSVAIMWWYFSHHLLLVLWVPILYFPCWCYMSFQNVFTDFSYPMLLAGGLAAEMCHGIVLMQAVGVGLDQTANLLFCIASGLFLFETFAFLCVVTALRPSESAVSRPTQLLLSSTNHPYNDSGP